MEDAVCGGGFAFKVVEVEGAARVEGLLFAHGEGTDLLAVPGWKREAEVVAFHGRL